MIAVTRRGSIAIARITHGKANAFDLELSSALSDMVAQFRNGPDTGLVVTGQGAMFSAGVDLLRVVDHGEPYVREFLPALGWAFEAVFACPKPVVAAINGHAIAGGCILACAADYRVMARGSGRIGIPELRVGVPFPVTPLEIMRFAAPDHLESLVYGGATYSADEALAQRIVDEVTDADALIDTAVAAAGRLAALPAVAFELTKRQVRGPSIERMRNGAPIDREVVGAWSTEETINVIRDYIARTFKKPAP